MVTEPLRNYTFNFTSLRNDLGRNVQGDEDKSYLFNICGSIGPKCNNSTVSACMIKRTTKKEFVIGTVIDKSYDCLFFINFFSSQFQDLENRKLFGMMEH